MTKVCTHLKGQEAKDKALAMLEDSLRRLKTDHLDLWQVHQILTETEADSIFMFGGVWEAIEQAKKQGKIRYCGFTGHADPKVHLRSHSHHYPFDSGQMPLSVFDGHEDGFQKLVLPDLLNQGIAPLAMKTLAVEGGSAIACARFPTPEEAKAKAMPSDDGLGLEEYQGVWPVWPEAPKANPKESVGGAEFRFVRPSFEHCQLMSERQVFKHEPGLGLKAGEQCAQKRKNDIEHGGVNFGGLC